MPRRRAVRMTRQAISPRLAIRIFLSIDASFSRRRVCRTALRPLAPSQWNVAVLAPGVLDLLARQHRQRAADALSGLVRLDHVVDVAARARDERVGELGLVFGLARGELPGIALLLAEDDLDRALGAHHRDLGVRPGEV